MLQKLFFDLSVYNDRFMISLTNQRSNIEYRILNLSLYFDHKIATVAIMPKFLHTAFFHPFAHLS